MKDMFIILPGQSLNDLTIEEKEYIKTRPTIASGHYLLFWETMGIIPDCYVHAGHGWDYPTNSIVPGGLFYGLCELCKHHKIKPKFYVTKETKLYLDGGPIPKSKSHPNLGKNLKPCPLDHGVETIAINISEMPSHHGLDIWAKTLTDKFWFNSGVGTAINLATVLYPGYDIKLLGNDGGASNNYFYNKDSCDINLITVFQRELKNWAKSRHVSKTLHYNMRNFNTQHPIKMVKETGGTLYNCNQKSFFTKGAENYITTPDLGRGNTNLFSIPYSNIK